MTDLNTTNQAAPQQRLLEQPANRARGRRSKSQLSGARLHLLGQQLVNAGRFDEGARVAEVESRPVFPRASPDAISISGMYFTPMDGLTKR